MGIRVGFNGRTLSYSGRNETRRLFNDVGFALRKHVLVNSLHQLRCIIFHFNIRPRFKEIGAKSRTIRFFQNLKKFG